MASFPFEWPYTVGAGAGSITETGKLPSGPAGGVLTGEYPNPSIAALAITAAMLGNKVVTEAKLATLVVEKLNPTAWEALALGAKVETAGLQVPGVRGEDGLTMGRLRGGLKMKEATLANEALATITAAGFRPPATIEFERVTSAGKLLRCKITAAGVFSCTEALVLGEIIFLDGFTYNLT